jgi:hypothetical protein
MLLLRKGDEVRVGAAATVEPSLRGVAGVVMGFRPDGLVVVRLAGGQRAPFRREELEARPGAIAPGS